MNVRFVFEMDVDVEDLNYEYVDVESYAKELALRELIDRVDSGDVTEYDFTVVKEG